MTVGVGRKKVTRAILAIGYFRGITVIQRLPPKDTNLAMVSLDDVAIREARETDAHSLVRLKKKVFSETDQLLQSLQDYDCDVEEERYLIRRYRHLDNSGLFVAMNGRQAVGFITLQGASLIRSRHVAQLGIAVCRDLWSQGIGRALMDYAIDWARANRFLKKISLLVYSDNERAISIYRAYGFVHEGVLQHEVYLTAADRYVDLVSMGLMLGPDV